MSTKPETTFYTSVHRHLPPVDQFYREKMYNPLRGGMWDFWYSSGTDLWVEYKFLVLPKRDSTLIQPSLSALQVDWGRGRYNEGRNLAVIVGCKEGGVILRNLEWEAPFFCAEFRKRLLTRQQIAAWLLDRTLYESTATLHHK